MLGGLSWSILSPVSWTWKGLLRCAKLPQDYQVSYSVQLVRISSIDWPLSLLTCAMHWFRVVMFPLEYMHEKRVTELTINDLEALGRRFSGIYWPSIRTVQKKSFNSEHDRLFHRTSARASRSDSHQPVMTLMNTLRSDMLPDQWQAFSRAVDFGEANSLNPASENFFVILRLPSNQKRSEEQSTDWRLLYHCSNTVINSAWEDDPQLQIIEQV